MNYASKARRFLINIGKTLPFIICFVVFIVYAENLFALTTSDFLSFGGSITPNTPISFKIASFFEYDLLVVFVALVISIAIEVCFWNRLALLYLALHLCVKSYLNFELEIETIYAITIVNIIVSFFFVCKGVGILIGNKVK